MSMGTAARWSAALCVAVTGLAAQNVSDWRAPSSGYFYDNYAKAVRPVIGFYGAAHLGAGVAEADWASIAPRGNSAWVASGGSLTFFPDLSRGTAIRLDGEWPLAVDARWAADGRSAVLAAAASVVVAAIDGNGSPSLERSLPIAAGATVRLLGASDDLSFILLATRGGGDQPWELKLWPKDGEPRQAGMAADPAASAFASKAGIFFIADLAAKSVLRLSVTGEDVAAPLLGESDGIGEPVGLVASSDGTRLHVIERGGRAVRAFDVASKAALAELALDESPDTPIALGSGRYLLNQRKTRQQSFLVLDVTGEPRVVFVPAGE